MTIPTSTAAAAREAHDMAINAKRDVNELKPRVTSLEYKQAAHERILSDLHAKGGLVKTRKGMERAHERITKLSQTLNGRLDTLEEALVALRAGGSKLFIDSVRASGVSDDDIKKALVILRDGDDPIDLSDDEFVAELFTAFMTFKSAVQDQLKDHDERLKKQDESITKVSANVTHLETAFKEVKSSVTTQNISMIPLIIGLVVGVVTYFVANAQDDVSGWRALGFAFAFVAITAGILSFFASQVSTKISEMRKSSQSTTSGTAEADTSNTRSSVSDDRTTQVVSAQDQTEHQPDLASAGSRS